MLHRQCKGEERSLEAVRSVSTPDLGLTEDAARCFKILVWGSSAAAMVTPSSGSNGT